MSLPTLIVLSLLNKHLYKSFEFTSWIFGNLVVLDVYLDKFICVSLKSKELVFPSLIFNILPFTRVKKLLSFDSEKYPFFA